MHVFSISCATSSKKDLEIEYIQLQGKWEGRDVSGKVGTVIFYEDRHIDLILDGKSMSKKFSKGNSRMKYSLNSSISPMELDIYAEDKYGDKYGKPAKMIIQFLTDNKIKIRTFFSNKRPENFLKEDDETIIILTRVE